MFGQGPARHQNRLLDAKFAQTDAFVENRNADVIHMRLDVGSDAIHAVTVSVGLEHDQHFGRRHPGANGLRVAAKLGEVDDKMGGAKRNHDFRL